MIFSKYKNIALISAVALSSFVAPEISLAKQNTLSEAVIKQSQQYNLDDVIINGSIDANSHYVIKSNSGRIIAKGQADSKGIFFDSIAQNSLKNTQSLKLTFNHQTISQNISPTDDIVVFKTAKTPLLFASDGFDEHRIATIVLFFSLAKVDATDNFILGLSVLLDSLFETINTSEDTTPEKLNELIDNINELQKNISNGFKITNQRFSDLFANTVNAKIIDNQAESAQLTKYLAMINNALASSRYEDFWDNHPEYRSVADLDFNNLSEAQKTDLLNKQKLFWQDLANYDKEKGINISSLTYVLKKVQQTMNKDEFSNFEIQNLNAGNLFTEIKNIRSQQQLKDNLNRINNNTLKLDLIGDSSSIYNVCSGTEKAMIFWGYAEALTNMINIKALNTDIIASELPSKYANLDQLNETFTTESNKLLFSTTRDNLNDCSFFDYNKGAGWPNITYLTISKDSKPYLVVVAPLKETSNLPGANELAYNKDNIKRKEIFSPEQNVFFNELLNKHWNETEQNAIGQQAAYTNNNELIVYYALNSTKNIQNLELIPKQEPQAEISDIYCSYNKCRITVENVPDTTHTLYFSGKDGGQTAYLQPGKSTIEHTFPFRSWTKNASINEYVILHNNDGDLEKRSIIKALPDIPYNFVDKKSDYIQDSQIWTNATGNGVNNPRLRIKIADEAYWNNIRMTSAEARNLEHGYNASIKESNEQEYVFHANVSHSGWMAFRATLKVNGSDLTQNATWSCEQTKSGIIIIDHWIENCSAITWHEPNISYSF